MLIYPAIDLLNGRYVMLKQGIFDKDVTHGGDPVAVALNFKKSGAKQIHVVDLDAARTGEPSNEHALASIVKETGLFVQTGGGVRTLHDIERKLKLGVSRVIIGTAAVKNPGFVKTAVNNFGENAVAVGIDAKNGFVAAQGWTEYETFTAVDLALKSAENGVKTIIYTDISKDGMMEGPNVEATAELIDVLRDACVNVIASGGVSCMDDLHNVKNIGSYGVIVGKALLQGVLDLHEIIEEFE
jgi:phosphoribosylformimino-5-aminoimidazole carboxamide ribotide isomerase